MVVEREPNDLLAFVAFLGRKAQMGKVAVNCLLGLGEGVAHGCGSMLNRPRKSL
jgi:hypothetical protein